MGVFKKAIAKHQERRDKKVDARIERKGSKVESKNRARENKVALKYAPQVAAAEQKIEDTAAATEQSVEQVANEVIQQPASQNQYLSYLNRKGVTPMRKPIDRAVQAYQTLSQDVLDRQNTAQEEGINAGNLEADDVNYEDYDAGEYIDEAIEEEFLGREKNSAIGDDPDMFLSAAAIAAISKGVPVLMEQVNAKRVKDGKKPLPSLDTIISGTNDNQTAVGKAAQEAQDAYIEQKRREEIKKMTPAIIGGVALLILLVAAITYFALD